MNTKTLFRKKHALPINNFGIGLLSLTLIFFGCIPILGLATPSSHRYFGFLPNMENSFLFLTTTTPHSKQNQNYNPKFSAVPSPENYQKIPHEFEIDTVYTGGEMFRTQQSTLNAEYYSGAPFKKGMTDFVYINFGEYIAQHPNYDWQLPGGILYYSDTISNAFVEKTKFNTGNKIKINTSLVLKTLPSKAIRLALEPFYFSKYEVTNKEYRVFLNWVRASNGFSEKQIWEMRTDTIFISNPNDVANVETNAQGRKFRLSKKSIPTKDFQAAFTYTFFRKNAEALLTMSSDSLFVYPDTLSWVNDFPFAYNEPMTNMYFWHPAYDNYPVVGVSWFQALAFLDWKSHMHQIQLDSDHIPYEIEYALPSEIEWELASTMTIKDHKTSFRPKFESSNNWLTDLGIESSSAKDSIHDQYNRTNYLKNLFTEDQYYKGDYSSDGFFETGPTNPSLNKNSKNISGVYHVDPCGIAWMDGNVSEWLMESYAENWKPFFIRHLLTFDQNPTESNKLAKQIEIMFDKGNSEKGRLVRGANWYDERFGGKPGSGRNEAGISPKRFVDPTEQHCTIGFRYVVHVNKK